MGVRDAVRSHWASLGKSERKPASPATSVPIQNVSMPAAAPSVPVYNPFKVVKSVIFDGDDRQPDKFELSDVLADSTLKAVWLFSFGFQLELIMSMVKEHVTVHIVGQLNTIAADLPLSHYPNLKVHRVDVPSSWGCHHSKIIFAFHQNGTLRMHLPSFNLSREEINLAQQTIWTSPILHEAVLAERKRSRFEDELIEYLNSYPSYSSISDLIDSLRRYKWHVLDEQNCQFVYSTPYRGGLTQLKSCLAAAGMNPHDSDDQEEFSFPNLFIQVSSMGNPFRKKLDLLQDVMLPYLYTDWFEKEDFDKKLKSKDYTTPFLAHSTLVWPTTHEMENCMTRGLSANWFFYKQSDVTKRKVTPCLRKHTPLPANSSLSDRNRHMVPSHTKYYIQFTDEKSITNPDWVLLTSHNLSQAAWGPSPLKKPTNYECGILYTTSLGRNKVRLTLQSSKCVPGRTLASKSPEDTSALPTVNVLTPYPMKFQRYSETDQPHTSTVQ
ncbi:unnamed protein product [Kluyveromyces dobzhanskii CBS 2104]|uniref:WGS project CCBQ000000000 data, contig 00015 n=1 Tax=Kluyveromyces dobzhanskii CBS 2104 TaxID=1427455 RepID=A0A0A8LC94_9SACH|nr:unnamed protein product [Kluyveromyces dobzhanskii CBS 2104]